MQFLFENKKKTIGGIKAVIWTDVFQALIMILGIIAVIAIGTFDIGGFTNLFDINDKGGRLNLFNFNPDPFIRQSFWSLIIGGIPIPIQCLNNNEKFKSNDRSKFILKDGISQTMAYAVDQQMMQRFSAAKNTKTAQLAFVLNTPGLFLMISLYTLTGLVVYANFSTCDPLNPLTQSGVKNPNQILSYFVMLKFNNVPFIPGLFLSSIFCASLSTISSALNSMSACIWRDYLMRFDRFKMRDTRRSSTLTKIIALICGLGCTAFAFLIGLSKTNLMQISSTINGALQAPIIGIFFVSSMFPIVNIYGLFAGALSGFAIVFWLALAQFVTKPNYPKLPLSISGCSSLVVNETHYLPPMSLATNNLEGFDKIYSLSYMWLCPVGFFTVIIVGLLVSFLTNYSAKNTRKIDDSLILYKYKKQALSHDQFEIFF